jgi:hypothetical protein
MSVSSLILEPNPFYTGAGMAKKQLHQSSISSRVNCDVSRKAKLSADLKRGAPGRTGTEPPNTRASAYLRTVACRGSKLKYEAENPSPAVTEIAPLEGPTFTTPCSIAVRPGITPANTACTFIDSVISLCRRSLTSDRLTSVPSPGEDMFLLLVRLCGVREAKFWAETMGFEHQQSYALLSCLL